MTREGIAELAAILVAEHGWAALEIAETRRDQHRRDANSAGHELWGVIAAAVARRLDAPASAEAGRGEG